MPLDDEAPPADDTAGSTSPRRRRTPRAWSSPTPQVAADPTRSSERFDRPVSESAWGTRPDPSTPQGLRPSGAGAGRRARSDRASATGPTSGPGSDLVLARPQGAPSRDPVVAALEALTSDVQSQLALLRASIADAAKPSDASLVSGAELATTIETLGNTLGTGIASLLSDHRALLARDVEAAADRILEEVGQRLRTATTQIVDGVEERIRHITAKGLSGLGEQLELRLDQLQSDVTGLRAVMLEIPDQTSVTSRLDKLTEAVGGGRREQHRLSPALSAGIERAVAGPIGRLETALGAVIETVQELEERVGDGGSVSVGFAGGPLSDPGAIEDLIAEMAALRRRISLRNDGVAPSAPADEADEDEPDVEPELEIDLDEAEDDDDVIEAVPIVEPAPARRAGRTVRAGKATKAPAKARAAKKDAAAKPARRRRSAD
jgi:hypothetical protein